MVASTHNLHHSRRLQILHQRRHHAVGSDALHLVASAQLAVSAAAKLALNRLQLAHHEHAALVIHHRTVAAAICLIPYPFSASIACGMFVSTFFSLAVWPCRPCPHAYTSPLLASASMWYCPQAIFVIGMFLKMRIFAGLFTYRGPWPWPNWP